MGGAAAAVVQLGGAVAVVTARWAEPDRRVARRRARRGSRGPTDFTLDDPATLRAAADDPVSFASYGDTPRVIDEVQLGGDDLVRSIKTAVDEDPRPGRFALSGSSRFLTIPTLSESLAGRIAFVDLWPPSMLERTGGHGDVLDTLFGDPAAPLTGSTWRRGDHLDAVTTGGYPEAQPIGAAAARRAWFDGYLTTVDNRAIKNFASLGRADAVATLPAMLAVRAGSLLNLSDLAPP